MSRVAKSDAKERCAAVAAALVPLQGARKGFVLEEDLEALDEPPGAIGVRLLHAKDASLPAEAAFLQAQGRGVLFPDPTERKAVFTVLSGPGVVLHEGLPVGMARSREGQALRGDGDALHDADEGGVGGDGGRGGAGGHVPRHQARRR